MIAAAHEAQRIFLGHLIARITAEVFDAALEGATTDIVKRAAEVHAEGFDQYAIFMKAAGFEFRAHRPKPTSA